MCSCRAGPEVRVPGRGGVPRRRRQWHVQHAARGLLLRGRRGGAGRQRPRRAGPQCRLPAARRVGLHAGQCPMYLLGLYIWQKSIIIFFYVLNPSKIHKH